MDAILVTIYVTRSTSNVGCYFSDYMSLDQSLNVGKCELLLFLGAYELLIFRCL